MEIVRGTHIQTKMNGASCSVDEYLTENVKIDFAIAHIRGREPEVGEAENLESIELVYVIEGEGSVTIDDRVTHIRRGDVIIISPGERFVWNGNLKLAIICTPRWSVDKHVIHNE